MKSIAYHIILLSFLTLAGCKSDKQQPSSDLKSKNLQNTSSQDTRSLPENKGPEMRSKLSLLPEALRQGVLKTDLYLSQPLKIVNTSFKIKGQKSTEQKTLSCNNKKGIGFYVIDGELVLENLSIHSCFFSAIKLVRSTLILNNVRIQYSGPSYLDKDEFGGFESQPVPIAALEGSTVTLNGDSEISFNDGALAGGLYLENNSRLEMNGNSSIKKN